MKLDKVRFAPDSEVGDFSRFFPVSARPVPEMLAEMDGIIASMKDPWIRHLLTALFVDDAMLREAFAKAPAAKGMHHVYLGGLLEHTLSILAMAERACGHYAAMNRDLVLAGVFLHDVGKTAELSYQRSFGYTDEGNLIGHISMECEWINREAMKIKGFPEELRRTAVHRAEPSRKLEFGSPVLPRHPKPCSSITSTISTATEAMFGDQGAGGTTGPISRHGAHDLHRPLASFAVKPTPIAHHLQPRFTPS